MKKLLLLFLLLITSTCFGITPVEVADENLTLEELISLYNRNQQDIYRRLTFGANDITINKIQQDVEGIKTKVIIERIGDIVVNNDNLYAQGIIYGGDGTIKSENFVVGVDGYEIDGDGNAEFNDIVARGTIVASSGTIGGWEILVSSLVSTNGNIGLDAANNKILVGTLTMDGTANSIQSDNYVSGAMGQGVKISPDLIEAGKLSGRLSIQTANFIKNNISAMGGNFLVMPSDTLASNMTVYDTSTLTTDGNETFSVDDILRIKVGTDDEWFIITSTDNTPTYEVIRDTAAQYTSDNNPEWTKGVTVVNYQQSGDGGVYLTASDINSPYLSVFENGETPWSSVTTKIRLGNLNGYLGYTEDKYGLGIGSSDGDNANMTFDINSGIRLRAGNEDKLTLDNNGNVYISGAVNLGNISARANWRIIYASYDNVNFNVGNEEVSGRDMTIKTDGTKMYIIGDANKTVFQYSLSTAWDITTASYDNISFSVSSQDTSPTGLSFSSDGEKMYIMGNNNNNVYQYSLSTAWDISTASYDSVNFPVSSEDNDVLDIVFKTDGTKMYIAGNQNNKVYQYTLSTAWDISTSSYNSVNFSVTPVSIPLTITFSLDGTNMYIMDSISDTLYQYYLTTGWDLSTASYSNESYDVSSENSAPVAVTFKADGTKIYIFGISINDFIYQYTIVSDPILYIDNNTEYVGISTSIPSYQLDVDGDIHNNGDILTDANIVILGSATINGQVGISSHTSISGDLTSSTLDTGQGSNELYDMDQNVTTTSDVTFSTLTTTNQVYARYSCTTTVTFQNLPWNFATKISDTHNSVTTGVAWKFTAPIAGIYMVTVSVDVDSTYELGYVRVNGSTNWGNLGSNHFSIGQPECRSLFVYLNKDDYVDFFGQSGGGGATPSGTALYNWIGISRLGQ
jgi:sugar lactone lactonase YvrE